MIKTKKNGLLKVACAMLVVMMLATCVISGTLAKYASKTTEALSASAQVAKWSVKVGETEIDALTADELTFKVYELDSKTKDEHVKTENLIAPGTWGYATVEIKNDSEVNADISATFTKTASGLPTGMTVAFLNAEPSSQTDVTGTETSVSNNNVAPDDSVKAYIAFVWNFDTAPEGSNDTNDTTFGKAASKLELGKVSINAEQVD